MTDYQEYIAKFMGQVETIRDAGFVVDTLYIAEDQYPWFVRAAQAVGVDEVSIQHLRIVEFMGLRLVIDPGVEPGSIRCGVKKRPYPVTDPREMTIDHAEEK